jgi:hypothetical protein
MIDRNRWSTADCLANGVLDRAAPPDACPKDANLASVNEDDLSEATLRRGLESGGLDALMYYGCWQIWKSGDAFDGELLQYRSVADQFRGLSIDDALDKAMEWGGACYG